MSLDPLRNNSWSAALPNHIGRSAAVSAFGSWCFTLIKTNNPHAALYFAGLAATASIIHSLLTPLFKFIMDRNNIAWYQVAAVFASVFAFTQVIVNGCVRSYKQVDFMVHIVGLTALTTLINTYEGGGAMNLNNNAWYFLF